MHLFEERPEILHPFRVADHPDLDVHPFENVFLHSGVPGEVVLFGEQKDLHIDAPVVQIGHLARRGDLHPFPPALSMTTNATAFPPSWEIDTWTWSAFNIFIYLYAFP